MKTTNKNIYITLLLVSALLWLFGLRFLLVEKEAVHYHANFAMYVDGTLDELSRFTFYEEVSACGGENRSNPKSRVHLHDQNPFTIHVHDNGATWGHLLANLGYSVSDDLLINDSGTHQTAEKTKLRFMLNGKEVKSIANLTINSEDVLLIDYSDNEESILLRRYNQIPRDAGEYNNQHDPASCAGGQGEEFWDRVKRTIGIDS